ncbi:MAG: divergent polysaccharide deacetylase family protein [Alphaproteobacteria bacterium]
MNKKDCSYYLGLLTCVLALFWVYLVFSGLTSHQENGIDKVISKQKIVLTIPEDKAVVEGNLVTGTGSSDMHKTITPTIALLIDKIDFSSDFIKDIKELPKDITIGVSPYNQYLSNIIGAAKENGNDIFMELPFIDVSADTPVKDYDLVSSFSSEEIHYRLQRMLSKIEHSVGVYNLGNEEFLSSVNAVSTVVEHLHKANLFFLYGVSNKTAILESDNESVFVVEACDLVVSKNQTKEKTSQDLRELEEIARSKGKAISVIQFNKVNIDILQDWIKTLDEKNIKLVSIKALPKKIKVSS